MRDVRLILMARPGPACDALRAEIEACGAACLTAANPVEMRETLFREPVNGLALDVPTLVAADRIGKGIIRYLVDLYPVVRVRWDAAAGKAFALYFGKTEGELRGLGTFVARDCAVFRARKLRSEARIAVMNVFWALITITLSSGLILRILGIRSRPFSSGITTSVITTSPCPSDIHRQRVAALLVTRT